MDFTFDGKEIRAFKKSCRTKSQWAQMAQSGKKVMQFLSENRHKHHFTGEELQVKFLSDSGEISLKY